MAESAPIQDVQERVKDFAVALRSAGAADVAERIERYASGFVRSAEVRRSVAAIQEQLRYFRTYPDELPDLPIVQVAANRLEDVCKLALAGGLIEPAKPSLRALSKRKLGVIVTTLAAAGLCFVLPLVLTMAGVDWDDVLKQRQLPPETVAQGEEIQLSVTALEESPDLAVTKGVEFYVRGRCAQDLGGGMHCKQAEPRELGGTVRPSFEITHDDQVYGVFVGFGGTQLLGGVGNGSVYVGASWDTPEGLYQLPLRAAFLGFTAEHCNLIDRALGRCQPPRTGDDAKYEDVPVAVVQVQVVKGDPRKPAEHMKQKKLEEERARTEAAERRAAELAKNVGQIKAVLDDTQALARKQKWESVRERSEKLVELFAPLDVLATGGGENEPLPVEVTSLRQRFEALRRQLQAFEDRAFDEAYAATRSDQAEPAPKSAAKRGRKKNKELLAAKASDEAESATQADGRLAAVAEKLGISAGYLDAIVAAHAEQYEARIAAEEATRQAKVQAEQTSLLKRCGELPTHAFTEVKGYLAAMGNSVRVKTRLNECLTPRLTEKLCWSVVCGFDEIVSGELTDTARPKRWTFMLKNGRVVEHADHVID